MCNSTASPVMLAFARARSCMHICHIIETNVQYAHIQSAKTAHERLRCDNHMQSADVYFH